jgi:amino acid adenylation domain-containing protein
MERSAPAVDASPAHAFSLHQQTLHEQCSRFTSPQLAFDWLTPGHTVPARVAALAALHPDQPAVFDTTATLTYRKLDQAANQIANTLLAACGDTPEIVAIFAGNDVTALVAALGVLKSGKAFVGFDDILPESRCGQILADTDNRVILYDDAHASLARRLAGSQRQLIAIEECAQAPDHAPAFSPAPDSIAILNYSSGTTGRPKGIVQTHHSVLAQAAAFAGMCHLGSADRVTNFGALAWAGTFWTLFGPLCFGAGVALFDTRRMGIDHLAAWLQHTGVTVIVGLTTVRQLVALAADQRFPAVRLIHLGGDTIYRRDIEGCRPLFPNALISAGLGATETGRIAEWLIDAGASLEHPVVAVGLPAPATRIFLLTESGDETAPGEVGEIAVQSSYLAQGYWKQPQLTAAKFRCDPRFGALPFYLTGDIGRIEPTGALRHVGRKDFQIKVRQYQVPVDEIEGRLLALDGIREACVARHHGPHLEEALIAYVVMAPGAGWRSDELQEQLAASLPEYMVPQRFVFLPELPKTPTQKVDRNRLPALTATRPALRTPFVAATTPIAARLAAIWAEVLGLAPIGIHDEFLALGGDSLRAAQLANRVQSAFALELPMTTLLKAATVAAMALVVEAGLAGRLPAAELAALLDELEAGRTH